MNDLESLLSSAAQQHPKPPSAQVVDADVTRGHRALTRRRMRRTAARSTLAGALAVGAFVVVDPGQHSSSGPTVAAKGAIVTTTAAPQVSAKPVSITLVAYTGEQPQGYTVDSVPSGWEIQGVNDFVLVIAPVGFPDRLLDSFEGKLVVMLQSSDVPTTPGGDPVTVAGRPGVVNHENPGEPILYYSDAAGHSVVVQQPPALHWDSAQLAAFAATLHVSDSAQPGKG